MNMIISSPPIEDILNGLLYRVALIESMGL